MEIKKRNIRMMWFVLLLLGINSCALAIAELFGIQKLFYAADGGIISLVLITLYIMETSPAYTFQLKGDEK